jgi:hypothetical protein
MATFNDILSSNNHIDDNDDVDADEINNDNSIDNTLENTINYEIVIDCDTKANAIENSNTYQRHTLFNFDETKPIEGNVAHDLIYYLDNTKIYTNPKPLGKYVLKNHQLTSLYFMRGLEQKLFDVNRIVKNPDNPQDTLNINTTHYTNVGVLSDRVGAGKSYCIMALINEAKSITDKQLPFRDVNYGSNNIGFKMQKYNKLDTNILLVPHSLVGQWKKYLENSGLKFYTVQKARDVFELADNTCKFKGKKFNMIATEDDEKVLDDGDDGDEGDEDNNNDDNDDNDDTKSTISEISTVSCKAKSVIGDTSATATKSKKKVNITKRTKEEIVAAEASEGDNKLKSKAKTKSADIDIDTINIDEITDKKELEKIKKMLSAKSTVVFAEYNKLSNQIWQFQYGSKERTDLQVQHNEIQHKRIQLMSKISLITNKIKNLELECGGIKVTEIQKIHANYADNSENLLPESLKNFNTNIGFLDKKKVEKLDVILVSATFYNLLALYFNKGNYTINRIIIDECNSVKGNRLVEIKRIFTWLVTSSIKSMMTSTGYILKLGAPHIQYGYQTRTKEKTVNSTGFILNMIKEMYENQSENNKLYLVNRPEYIEQSMALPEMKAILIISKDNLNIQVLGGLVSHDIMQMLNAGDIEGIVTKLDVAVGDENNVIEMVTRRFQDELKVKEYELKVAIENPKYNPNNETIGVINKRVAISELKKKIECIEERVKTIESCPVCFDDFTNPSITPCCNNKFCFDCITMVLTSKSQCPMCREELNINNMIVISDKIKIKTEMIKSVEANEVKPVKGQTLSLNSYEGKLELLIQNSKHFNKYENMDKIFELNNKNPIRKYLIFTEYESTLNEKITSLLNKWNLNYARIKGSGIMISNLIDQYKTGNINTLLINSKYFGSGMNLENTTDIIIIHKMQSDIEMQVIGRAQRFGRVGNLRVWKLYYQNEMEN